MAIANTRRVRVPKTAELIAAKVRREIVLGLLKEGEPLPPESNLMEQFGVSRPTLREAYRILESEGLISVRRGAHGGGRVHTPSAAVAARYAGLVLQFRGTKLAEIYEARSMLEAPCAALAAVRRTEAGLKRLRALNEEAAAAETNEEMLVLHHRFHAELVEMAGNRTVTLMATMIDAILDEADALHVARATEGHDESRRAQKTHVKLVELLEARNGEEAERLWRSHLNEAAKQVLRDLGSKTVLEVME
ncbi:MAG: FadR family transcriptional regulator [Acidimicrobiales bacterium]|nr:FadR family transcriptional regulator [Acidimicrobiales bacterium]